MTEEQRSPLPCAGLVHLFFSPEDDGRDEAGRRARELKCKKICFKCPYRIPCLRSAVEYGDRFGVWGGLSEHEMRLFRVHLRFEGYEEEVPDGLEFLASLASFYTHRHMYKIYAKEAEKMDEPFEDYKEKMDSKLKKAGNL